jgi:hypothetical protein
MNAFGSEEQGVPERRLSLDKQAASVPAPASKEPDALHARLVEHANAGDCEDIVWDALRISIKTRRGGVTQATRYVLLRSEVCKPPIAVVQQDGCLFTATDSDAGAGKSSDVRDGAQFASALAW